jgi:phosphoribosylformylglycinamidine synthase
MLGKIENKDRSYCDMAFKDAGDVIVLLGVNKEEKHACPEIDIELEKSVQKTCYEAIKLGIVKSAHDTAEGGLSVALAECAIEGEKGAVVNLDEEINNTSLLFDETQSRIILSIEPEQIFVLNDIAMLNRTPVDIIGKVSGKSLKIGNGNKRLIDVSVSKLAEAYKGTIPKIMGS